MLYHTPLALVRPIENSDRFDSSRPTNEQFRRGNFCEWSITAALWDIFDTPALNYPPTSESWDTINRSFADIFAAFSAQLPLTAGAKYPQDINRWWYNWTNSVGSRPGEPSLGDEQGVLDIFAEHAISTGYRIELAWTNPDVDLDAHLWLPAATPAHIFYEELGTLDAAPFAALDQDVTTSGMTETITIVKPVLGTYQYGVFNWTHQNDDPSAFGIGDTGAEIVVYD